METLALVKPTVKEQLFVKITEIKQKKLTAAQVIEIMEVKRCLTYAFERLVWTYFGLSKEQILELSEQEIEALSLLTLERSKRMFIFLWILQVTVPFIGLEIASETDTMMFRRNLRKIKKMLGVGLNLGRILREGLTV